MRHDVLLTAGATRDLERLHEYIRRTDSLAGANRVLDVIHVIADGRRDFRTLLEERLLNP